MTQIDAKDAAQALSDVNEITQRVRQSRIYESASQIMIAAGALVVAGYLANLAAPRYGGYIWITVNVLNIVCAALISVVGQRRTGVRAFDARVLASVLLFYSFGLLFSTVLGHLGPREMGTFWPIYYMLFYCVAGLWFGRAFIAIGLAITVLVLIGYFFIAGAGFLVWMALANGGGLIVSGLVMRWGD